MQNATEMKCANKHAETGAATSWPTALVLNYFAQFYSTPCSTSQKGVNQMASMSCMINVLAGKHIVSRVWPNP